MKEICIYGAGGHGKVVADIVCLAREGHVLGFLDDAPDAWNRTVLGLPILGGFDWLRSQGGPEVEVALGIGNNARRREVAQRIHEAGRRLHTAVHPSAVVARAAVIGAGTVIMAHAVVNPDAHLGEGIIVNTAAVLEHDVWIGDFAHISPNATLGGGASVGPFSHIGLGAMVLPRVRVGERVVVGAGAVVTRDTANDVVLVGVPAREHRNSEGHTAARGSR